MTEANHPGSQFLYRAQVRWTLVALLALVAGVACAGILGKAKRHAGKGNIAQESRDAADFTSVTLKGIAEVEITIGPTYQVVVSAPEELLSSIEVDTDGDELIIDCDDNNYDLSDLSDWDVKVEITMPALDGVAMEGMGSFAVRDLKAERFSARLSGMGDIEIDGEAGAIEVVLGGIGDIRMRKLFAKTAEVSLSGVGDVALTATEEFDGRLSGMGDITCYGSPDEISKNISGLGDIDIRR